MLGSKEPERERGERGSREGRYVLAEVVHHLRGVPVHVAQEMARRLRLARAEPLHGRRGELVVRHAARVAPGLAVRHEREPPAEADPAEGAMSMLASVRHAARVGVGLADIEY